MVLSLFLILMYSGVARLHRDTGPQDVYTEKMVGLQKVKWWSGKINQICMDTEKLGEFQCVVFVFIFVLL